MDAIRLSLECFSYLIGSILVKQSPNDQCPLISSLRARQLQAKVDRVSSSESLAVQQFIIKTGSRGCLSQKADRPDFNFQQINALNVAQGAKLFLLGAKLPEKVKDIMLQTSTKFTLIFLKYNKGNYGQAFLSFQLLGEPYYMLHIIQKENIQQVVDKVGRIWPRKKVYIIEVKIDDFIGNEARERWKSLKKENKQREEVTQNIL